MGLETVARYSGYWSGRIDSSISVRSSLYATVRHPFYRVNHVAFLHSSAQPDLRWMWTENAAQAFLDQPKQNEIYCPRLLGRSGGTPPPCPSSLPAFLWAGRADGSRGLYCQPTRADIDGVPSVGPHGLLGAPASLLHLNALDFGANTTPIPATEIRLDARWWTQK